MSGEGGGKGDLRDSCGYRGEGCGGEEMSGWDFCEILLWVEGVVWW